MKGDGYLDTLLMFLQEQEVFIYSLKEMCPLSQPQKVLSCPAVVTCLFLLPARKEVSAPTCSHCHVNYASGCLNQENKTNKKHDKVKGKLFTYNVQ